VTGVPLDLAADQPGPLSEAITIRLTRGQLLSLARLVRVAYARKARQKAKEGTFIPEPGCRDATLVAMARYDRLAATLAVAIGPGYNLDDGGRPSRRPHPAGDNHAAP
jgi:hypothetical protein